MTKKDEAIQKAEELKNKKEQCLYGANLSLKTEEFAHLKKCAEELIKIEHEMSLLRLEKKSENSKDSEFENMGMCMKCKEWTELGNSCCGDEYVQIN